MKERIHELKTDPEPFHQSWVGLKPFEIRLNDRDFQYNDILVLKETVHSGEAMKNGAPLEYTGRQLTRRVLDVRSNYGMQDGWCVLGCEPI